jgi:hypothetical protein
MSIAAIIFFIAESPSAKKAASSELAIVDAAAPIRAAAENPNPRGTARE